MRKKKSMRASKIIDGVITYLLLIIISLIFVFPIIWLIMASFSKTGSIFDFDGFFSNSFSLNNFHTLFTDTKVYDYPSWLKNTLIVSVGASLFGTILVILTAYTISQFRFKSRKLLMRATLILSMFPSFMGMTALYMLMNNFKLVNNLWSLILVYSATAPLGYLTQKGYFDSISNSIYESARIDGASNSKIFIKITLPLAKPMLVYTLLTSFTFPWSDFILPTLVLKKKNMWTVAVGLMNLGETEFTRFACGAVFIAVPIVILYFALSRFLIQGATSGAVKG